MKLTSIHRWNHLNILNIVAGCSERAITVLPNVRKYFAAAKNGPNDPTKSEAGKFVSKALEKPFLEPQLQFFNTMALIFEPTFTKFQADKPMLPFLHADLENLVRGLLRRFVRKEVLDEAKTSFALMKIDLSLEVNLKTANKVDLGVAVESALTKVKAKDVEKLRFRNECRTFLIKTAAKLVERCPFKYKLVQAVGCLSPSLMAKKS